MASTQLESCSPSKKVPSGAGAKVKSPLDVTVRQPNRYHLHNQGVNFTCYTSLHLLFSFGHRICNHHLLLFLHPVGDSDFAAAIKESCTSMFKVIILDTDDVGVIFVDILVQQGQGLGTIQTPPGVVQIQADLGTTFLVSVKSSAGLLIGFPHRDDTNVQISGAEVLPGHHDPGLACRAVNEPS